MNQMVFSKHVVSMVGIKCLLFYQFKHLQCLLCSIYALFAQYLINSNIVCYYLILYCKNFIMAYPLQIFFVGPLVRNIFRIVFKKQLKQI